MFFGKEELLYLSLLCHLLLLPNASCPRYAVGHSPFFVSPPPIIYKPLEIRRLDTRTATGRRSTEYDHDITPRPLHIKKVKKSHSMPFRKKGRGGQGGNGGDRGKRGFPGINFPPSSWGRSSCAGVLDDRAIDLPPEVFMRQMKIHILGIGPVFWARNEIGSSGWCFPLSTSGPMPNNKTLAARKCL